MKTKKFHIWLAVFLLATIGIAILWAYVTSFNKQYSQAEDTVQEQAQKYKRQQTCYTLNDTLSNLIKLKKIELDLTEAKIKFDDLKLQKMAKEYSKLKTVDTAWNYDYDMTKVEIKRLYEKLGIEKKLGYNLPLDLFYVFLEEDKTYVTQAPRQHYANNGLLATDLGTHGQSLKMYAPDMYNQEVTWTISYKSYPDSTGDTIILTNAKLGARWLVGHIAGKASFEEGAQVRTGELIGYSGGFLEEEGVSTGPHVHLEFYTNVGSKWLVAEYKIGESNKHELWHWEPDTNLKGTEDRVDIYMSGYNAGDVFQNDSAACISASGNNICTMLEDGKQPVALTSDTRNLLGVEWGDLVNITCDDGRLYVGQVEDEMNARFRKDCITSDTSQGRCIKGDIAFPLGAEVKGCLATVTKI